MIGKIFFFFCFSLDHYDRRSRTQRSNIR